MHRSGTSVTTNLLNGFGVALSDDLMEPTEHNAKGYFESKEIARIHDSILQTMGMQWTTSNLVVPLPKDWWRAPEVQPLKAELAGIIAREMERHGGVWGFKDPRTARVLPVWMELIQELDLDASFVLVTRHPADVAKSLFAREQIDPMHAEVMWLEHNTDAILNSGGKICAVVEYSRWMSNPVEQAEYMLEKLQLDWAGTRQDIERITGEIISPDLRHHNSTQAVMQLPFTAPFYDALLRRDIASLNGLAEVFKITRGFTQIILAHGTKQMRAQIEYLTHSENIRAGRIAALERELEVATARIREMQVDVPSAP